MISLVQQIEKDIAPIEVAVFNIGANVRFGTTETATRVYTKVWEMACLGGFLMGRETAKVMLPRGRGTIIFTGAPASLRGREGLAAFAGAKHALRALAQSMACGLGRKGIHVAHPVIDAANDTAFIRDNFPERYALKDQDGIVQPSSMANAYWNLHQQSAMPGRRDGTAALDGNVLRPGRCQPQISSCASSPSLLTEKRSSSLATPAATSSWTHWSSVPVAATSLPAPRSAGSMPHRKSLSRRSANRSQLDEFEALDAMAPQTSHNRWACISRLKTRPARTPVSASPTPSRICTHDSGPP